MARALRRDLGMGLMARGLLAILGAGTGLAVAINPVWVSGGGKAHVNIGLMLL